MGDGERRGGPVEKVWRRLRVAKFANSYPVPVNPVNRNLVNPSAAATDTIDYVVTDNQGLTSTSTRTVIVQAPSATVQADATTTQATSTFQ